MRKKVLSILVVMILLILGVFIGSSAAASIEVDSQQDQVKILSDVYIAKDQVMTGDIVGILGDVKLEGQAQGDVVAILGDIEVQGEVQGDVVAVLGDIEATEEIQGDAVAVLGDVAVKNKINGEAVSVLGSIILEQGGEVFGKITEVEIGQINENIHLDFPPLAGFFSWWFKLVKLVFVFALAVLILAIMPNRVEKMAGSLEEEVIKKILVGLGVLVGTPIIVFALIISLMGLPLIPLFVGGLFLIRLLGFVAIALFVGKRIERVGGLEINTFIKLALGVLVLEGLRLIPVVGAIFWLLITILALGVVISTKFGTAKPWFEKSDY